MYNSNIEPLGNPSCCSSLSNDSPSTECLAALDKMKDRAAIAALISDSSVKVTRKILDTNGRKLEE